MRFNSKKLDLLILAITAIVCARAVFAVISDPEGPNLLVVLGMAAFIYIITAIVYLSKVFSAVTSPVRTVAAAMLQMGLAGGLYVLLR